MSVAELAHILIEDALDDLEDIEVAEQHLANRLPKLSSDQARAAPSLGFGDVLANSPLCADDLPERRPVRAIARNDFA